MALGFSVRSSLPAIAALFVLLVAGTARAGAGTPATKRRACATPVLVDAYRSRTTLPTEERAVIDAWLAPPPPMPYQVESGAPFPVRVYFTDPGQQAYAEHILEAAKTAYQREVEDWGFYKPLVEAGGPYRIYLDDPGPGAAAYTSPYLTNPDTPIEDAFTYMVIDPALDDLELDVTVAHEFNHACQSAMDMTEPSSFFENTSTYIEGLVFPAGKTLTVDFYQRFQAKPFMALEYAPAGQSDGYEYGAALWLNFLAHEYGKDDPIWIRGLWEGSIQEGPINEPDHIDVLSQRLGGLEKTRAAIEKFGITRYFVGSLDDGAHLPSAGTWHGAEVWTSASFNQSQLPVKDATPSDSTRPRPGGCNYITFAPDASKTRPLRFTFDGDATLDWTVDLLELSGESGSKVEKMTLDQKSHGTLTITPSSLDSMVLVVCQTIADNFDLDAKYWPQGDYQYGIEYDIPAPTIESVEPATVGQGAQAFAATIRGHGFYDGEELSVKLSGTKAAVTDVKFVSSDELSITLAVAPSAELGARDVIVTNPGGSQATASGALTIVGPESPPVTSDHSSGDDAGGCGCRVSGASSRDSAGFLALAGAALWLSRRRGARRPSISRRPTWLGFLLMALLMLFAPAASAANPPSDGFVESTKYPIRVHYTNSLGSSTAQEALGYAEQAWSAFFVQMGFAEPMTQADDGTLIPGIWIYLDPGSNNFADAIGGIPETPRTDCATRISIASTSPSTVLESVMATEMAQAALLGEDCGESTFAWKSSAVALTSLASASGDPLFAGTMLPVFQRFPNEGLDCTFAGDPDKLWYHYGAALFWLFLDQAHGSDDGKLIAKIWHAARQNGNAFGFGLMDVDNEPDVLDAVGNVLPEVTLERAITEFARWRYFVGDRDDGAHFKNGSQWFGAEVALDKSLTLGDLPIKGAAPVQPLGAFGTSYIELDVQGIQENAGVKLHFDGDPSVRWSVDALLVHDNNSAEIETLELGDAKSGELSLGNLTGYRRATLAITNLAEPGHDPDLSNCNVKASFSYDLDVVDLATPPTVLGVEPSKLSIGQSQDVWVSGKDFSKGLSLQFGPGVVVSRIDFVDQATLSVALSVDANATPGTRDLVITNPNGKSSTLSAAVTLELSKPAPTNAGNDDSSGGCGCRVASSSERSLPTFLGVAMATLLAWRRRRRVNRQRLSA